MQGLNNHYVVHNNSIENVSTHAPPLCMQLGMKI